MESRIRVVTSSDQEIAVGDHVGLGLGLDVQHPALAFVLAYLVARVLVLVFLVGLDRDHFLCSEIVQGRHRRIPEEKRSVYINRADILVEDGHAVVCHFYSGHLFKDVDGHFARVEFDRSRVECYRVFLDGYWIGDVPYHCPLQRNALGVEVGYHAVLAGNECDGICLLLVSEHAERDLGVSRPEVPDGKGAVGAAHGEGSVLFLILTPVGHDDDGHAGTGLLSGVIVGKINVSGENGLLVPVALLERVHCLVAVASAISAPVLGGSEDRESYQGQ